MCESAGERSAFNKSVIVLGQITFGFVLLTGAVALIDGYLQMPRRDPGPSDRSLGDFRPEDYLSLKTTLSGRSRLVIVCWSNLERFLGCKPRQLDALSRCKGTK